MNGYLKELEQKTTAQVMVLTLVTLDGASIEDLSMRIAHETWKIGQKAKDNGALLLVAHKDREYRFEIGYGLEGVLPDSLVGSIGRQYLVPNFRREDYSQGIFQAVVAMVQPIAKEAGVEIVGLPAVVPRPFANDRERAGPSLPGKIASLLLLLLLGFLLVRHPRWFALLFAMLFMGGRGGSSWGGGGGFGGGGGGGFGGGGASGSW